MIRMDKSTGQKINELPLECTELKENTESRKHQMNRTRTKIYVSQIYSTAKETRKFVTLKLIKTKYVEFKKYMLHVKLTVYS